MKEVELSEQMEALIKLYGAEALKSAIERYEEVNRKYRKGNKVTSLEANKTYILEINEMNGPSDYYEAIVEEVR